MRERFWCAMCQYPGLDEFVFGTVAADGYEAALAALAAAWGGMSPHPPPPRFDPIPGQLVFRGGDDA